MWGRLEDAGYAVGARVLELLCHREKVRNFDIGYYMYFQNLVLGIVNSLSLSLSLCVCVCDKYVIKLTKKGRCHHFHRISQ